MKKKNLFNVITLLSTLTLVGCVEKKPASSDTGETNTENPVIPDKPTVETIDVKSISVAESSFDLKVGDGKKIVVSFEPSNATNQQLEYESTDETIAMVSSSGNVKALSAGSATITVKSFANSEAKATVTVNVTEREETNPFVEVNDITLSKNSVTLDIGKTEQITTTFTPENATNKLLKYSSDHEEIAMVNNTGTIRAISDGDATITVESESNSAVKKTVSVHVNKAAVSITKVELNDQTSLNDTYDVRQSVDFNNVSLKVTYSDKTTKVLTHGECDINKNNAQSDTEFILQTNGLSSQVSGSLIAKDEYVITATLIEDSSNQYYVIKRIQVVDDMSLLYDLTLFEQPESIRRYKANVASAGVNSETSFKDAQEIYTIGDDNEFIYKPKAEFTNELGIPVTAQASIKAEVYNLTNTGEKGQKAEASEYSFDAKNYSFKFDSKAIGKQYRIEVLPKDYAKIGQATIQPLTLDIKVEDGYNAYTALDLGRMNIIEDKGLISQFSWNTAVYNDSRQAFNEDYYRGMYYDPDSTEVHTSVYPYYSMRYRHQIWEDFLESKGEENLHQINGLFIHDNINITPADIPESFIVSEAEAIAMSSGKDSYAAGTLRDWSILYTHYLENDEFTLNGNCFTLDSSKMKCGRSKITNHNWKCDLYSENDTKDSKGMGNSALFFFKGRDDGKTMTGAVQPKAKFENVQSIGNLGEVLTLDKNDSEYNKKIEDAAGSLVFLRMDSSVTEVKNVIAKYYQIGFMLNGALNHKTAEIEDSRVYDCFTSGLCSNGSNGVYSNVSTVGATSETENVNTIKNSELKRFGGPAVLLQSSYQENTKTSSNFLSTAGIVADSDCVFESFVDGTEPWFSFNGATTAATNISGQFEPLMKMYGNSVLFEKGADTVSNLKMNMAVVGIDTDYFAAKTQTRIRFNYGDYASFDTMDNKVGTFIQSTQSALRQTFSTALASSAPVVRLVNKDQSKDSFGYVDPSQGIVSTTGAITPYINPKNNQLTGAAALPSDYVQILYPMGSVELAIVLQTQGFTLPSA